MLVLSAQSTYTGTTSVNSGTLALGTNHTLDVDNAVTLAGGTLDMGNYTNTLDTLTVTSGSVITLGSGELSFTDSSSITWTGELALAGTLGETTLRFGTTSSGLTRTQLARITINGLSVTLNEMGYVVPSPGTVLLLM
jgi:autotransporter-associated beta strand protein